MSKKNKKRDHWLYKEIHPILVVTVTIMAIFVGAAFFVLVFEMQYVNKSQQEYRMNRIILRQGNPTTTPKTSQY